MAWIEPVINRPNAMTRTTYADFNRICGNCNISFGTSLKEDWTVNDIVDETTWNTLIETVKEYDSSVSYSTDYMNLNKIEKVIASGGREFVYPSEDLVPSTTLYPL